MLSQSPSISIPALDRMTTSVLQGRNTSPLASAGCPSKVACKNELQDNLNTFFNSDARNMQACEQGVLQLYALQLQEAHTTIHFLEAEINHFQNGINIQGIRAQNDNKKLQARAQDEATQFQAKIEKLQTELSHAQCEISQLNV